MPDDRPDLESRLEELSRRLASVESRLTGLERTGMSRVARSTDESDSYPDDSTASDVGAHRWFSTEALPRYGRTIVVFGGAFLLRAITEGGIVPQTVGTGLGIVYAMFWIVMVDRAAASGRLRSATFHGMAAVGIAFPLLWEATVKFGFLPPLASAGALAAITAAGLFVAARRRLQGFGWVVTLGSAATALALAVSTKMWSLFVFELLLLALVVLWLGYEREWRKLAWCVCSVAVVTVLLMTAVFLLADEERTWQLFSPNLLMAMQLAWVVIFFASVGYRKISSHEDLTAAEIGLGLATLAVGFGGAMAVARTGSVSVVPLGVVSVVLAAGLYGVAFVFADRKLGRRQGFMLYSTFALLVTLIASGALLDGPALVATLLIVAVVTTWLGTSKGRATLSLHGAVYIVAAALGTGLLRTAVEVFSAREIASPGWIYPYPLAVVAVGLVFFSLPVAAHGKTWGRFSSAPMFAVITVLAVGIGAIAVTLAGGALPATEQEPTEPGMLAALRTGVLAALAVLLAWLGRRPRWPEALWLVYPLLAVGAIKLLIEDVRRGRPATLFVSFVLYGAALILAPRIARHRSS